MVWDHDETPATGSAGETGEALAGELDDEQWAAIKAELAPDEPIVWAERAGPPPAPTIGVFPALFAAVLCGASGFALMVLFGIYGLRAMSPAETVFYLGLAPAALGLVVALGILGRWGQHLQARRRLSHTFYVLTDRRAIVGSDVEEPGRFSTRSWTPDLFDGTLCIEREDGSGDLFFTRFGEVVWPEEGLLEVTRASQVDALVRQALLGTDGDREPGPIPGVGLDEPELIIGADD